MRDWMRTLSNYARRYRGPRALIVLSLTGWIASCATPPIANGPPPSFLAPTPAPSIPADLTWGALPELVLRYDKALASANADKKAVRRLWNEMK